MESRTGSESPQSLSATFYYKGFGIQVTKRDPSIDIQPLLTAFKTDVDWAIANGFLPSWNKDTNKDSLGEQKKSIPTQTSAVDQTTDWLDKPVDKNMCLIHPDKELRMGQWGAYHFVGKDTTGKKIWCKGK